MEKVKKLFDLGQVVSTPGALHVMDEMEVDPVNLLLRHSTGEWGDLDPHDIKVNDQAVKNGGRIMSSYNIGISKIWVITERDRSVTTFLLPEDY
jgi:hypothetical protein